MRRRFRVIRGRRLLATSLARAAFGANSARAGPDDLIAAAMRTNNVHEHVPQRLLHAIGVAAAVTDHLWLTIVRRMARDHVDQFISAGPRQIRHRPVERFLFHFGNFFQRQLTLPAAR